MSMPPSPTEQHQLLPSMLDAAPPKQPKQHGEELPGSALEPTTTAHEGEVASPASFKTYKRRWIGLAQLTLLNIVVSWCWLTYAPVSTSAALYFGTTETTINWLSTAFLFAFVAASPATIYLLNRGGPKDSILAASVLTLVGNWVRYAGAQTRVYGVVMLGQIIIGLAQPFVLAAPTRYSDMWFTERGRVGATALASLANPLGGALGQLIDPAFATDASQVGSMTLYIAIICSVVALLSLLVPRAPPTPPSATAQLRKPDVSLRAVGALAREPSFWLLFVGFAVYVTAFNAFSSELNNILYPYGFDETSAGITGALLILVGLGVSAALSPVFDRVRWLRIPAIKVLVPIIAAMYLGFIWAPGTRSVAAPYAIAAVLGSASFALLPLALELLVEFTYPVNPELSSTICWAAGQVGGGVVIIIMDALKGSWKGEPEGNMKGGLVFLAVLALVAAPFPCLLGVKGWGRERRREFEAMQRRGGS